MNNSWNKIIYKAWSPVYESIFNTGRFRTARLKIFKDALFPDGATVLFTGIGTGADLAYIDHGNLEITAVDYSKDMLKKAKAKYNDTSIRFLEMDAQHLSFEDASFDFVVASLILSVVPNPDACFKEMERVLKEDGQLIIFDKFTPGKGKLSFRKRLIRPVISVLGTDIGIDFEELYRKNNHSMTKMEDSPVMMNGMYRKIVLKKG
ncbi:class I SAM-dependent methyltransferase [Pseudalkalibacillus salsuginis]|uniref:class I SAM-dependent methyltransferase n=1 Tax=Pseudalkalibacillus salsuginis TaxID=2910972 RepID=UPI001F2D7C3A|nr:class I SAM-dependent methyltransferase [Pseudalkalibacillus salsuginis]MCF6409365.1 class I SAM-dependent methyltransferase [Pseudalkalibacillus salsuginis]